MATARLGSLVIKLCSCIHLFSFTREEFIYVSCWGLFEFNDIQQRSSREGNMETACTWSRTEIIWFDLTIVGSWIIASIVSSLHFDWQSSLSRTERRKFIKRISCQTITWRLVWLIRRRCGKGRAADWKWFQALHLAGEVNKTRKPMQRESSRKRQTNVWAHDFSFNCYAWRFFILLCTRASPNIGKDFTS